MKLKTAYGCKTHYLLFFSLGQGGEVIALPRPLAICYCYTRIICDSNVVTEYQIIFMNV